MLPPPPPPPPLSRAMEKQIVVIIGRCYSSFCLTPCGLTFPKPRLTWQDFYQKNMTKVQTKLKECVEKQSMSMDSLERLSKALDTTTTTISDSAEDTATMMVDDGITDSGIVLSEELLAAKELKGENMAPKKSKKKKKHAVKAAAGKTETKEKRRPRYFVQF
jgi:hypothetical protein